MTQPTAPASLALVGVEPCPLCGQTPSVVVGLPVVVTFRDGCATVEVDLAELPDVGRDDVVVCEHLAADDEARDAVIAQVVAALTDVATHVAPSVDYTLWS